MHLPKTPAPAPVPTPEELQQVTDWLRGALGGDVKVAAAPIPNGDPPDDLFEEEAQAMVRAVPRRRHEFATGRRLARRLLRELGFAEGPLVPKPDRSPNWPRGAVGAITHSKNMCIVVAARGSPDESLGIDVEAATDLQDDLRRLVCTPSEARWLEAQPTTDQGRLGKLFFSAKETLYKCQHPITSTFLGFHQAEIELMREAGRFDATILHSVGSRFGDGSLRGRLLETDRWIVTAMRWPDGPAVR